MIPPAFRRVLSAEGAARLVLASLVGRLPVAFTSLATVLLVREHTGSFATAGLVAAAEAVGVRGDAAHDLVREAQPFELLQGVTGVAGLQIGVALVVEVVEHSRDAP